MTSRVELRRHRRRPLQWVSRGAGITVALVVAAATIAACSSGGHKAANPPPTSSGGASTVPHPASQMCGFLPGVRPHKILLIWEENHSYNQVIGSTDAPTFNSVASTCGSATHYQALSHPSLPNYLEATSGQYYSTAAYDDCNPTRSCVTSNQSVFGQETTAGKSWKLYAEDMPSNCYPTNSGNYAVRHNPAPYYPSLASQCATNDVPLGTPSSGALATDLHNGKLPTLSAVTPNIYNDMHSGPVTQADSWLRQWLTPIVQGADYQSGNLVVVIAWDEGADTGNPTNAAPLLVMSAAVHPGSTTAESLNNYSVLRAIDEVSGLPPLGQAATVKSVTAPFGLS